jgi:hypothetical protein
VLASNPQDAPVRIACEGYPQAALLERCALPDSLGTHRAAWKR